MISWFSSLFPPKRRPPQPSSTQHPSQQVIFIDIVQYDESLKNKFGDLDILSEVLEREMVIYIASFLDLRSVYNFGRVNRFMIKLLFCLDEERLDVMFQIRETLKKVPLAQFEKEDAMLIKPDLIREYEKEEVQFFALTQNLVWKNLVFIYFPNFVKELNVKNWLHVMRRRIVHLKENDAKGKIPQIGVSYTRHRIPNFSHYNFIENCKEIYICPLAPTSICFRCNKEEGGKRIKKATNPCEFKELVNNSECVYLEPIENTPITPYTTSNMCK